MRIKEENLKSILEYFYYWERKTPSEIYLRQPFGNTWKTYTWEQVGVEARKMAAALRSLGVQEGEHVGIISKNCAHWIICDLAIMMCKAVSVPFFPNISADSLKELIEHSDIQYLFVGKLENWHELSNGILEGIGIIAFPHYEGNDKIDKGHKWQDLMHTHLPIQDNPLPNLHDLWTIIYTSGTTGKPKGVMHSHYNVAALIENERLHNDLHLFESERNRFFSYLPLNHIAERAIIEAASLFTGGMVSFGESLAAFPKNLADTQPSIFMSVPRIWTKFQLAILEKIGEVKLNKLLKIPLLASFIRVKIQKALGLGRAKIVLTGAAPTPKALHLWYEKIGIELCEVYAMTENCGGCALMRKDDRVLGSVGKPLANVSLRIDDSTGEVCVKAPWLMLGYYKDKKMTAEVLKDGFLHTGDKGFIDDKGYLRLTGRVKDTFKSAKGKFIVPAPIEWEFAQNTLIEQICLVGLGIAHPIALLVLSEQCSEMQRKKIEDSLSTTLNNINQRLQNHEKVSTLVVMKEAWTPENGLLTPTMKIKRHALDEVYSSCYLAWDEDAAVIIWQE